MFEARCNRERRSLFLGWASHIIIITILCLRRRIILKSKKLHLWNYVSWCICLWGGRGTPDKLGFVPHLPPREIVQNPWMDPKGSFQSSLERLEASKAILTEMFSKSWECLDIQDAKWWTINGEKNKWAFLGTANYTEWHLVIESLLMTFDLEQFFSM